MEKELIETVQEMRILGGIMDEVEGQLGAFIASLSCQTFPHRLAHDKVKRLRFC